MKALFFHQWHRKAISLVLAFVIWTSVNRSMVISKSLYHVPVRVVHLPEDQAIEDMQLNGLLHRHVTLNVTGNKSSLEDLTGKEIEIVIDADETPDEWIATITKKHLVSLNPHFDIAKAITHLEPTDLIMKKSKRVTEKIPILITQPIGEAPKGYQFLDVWPYQLFLTVNGPEELIKQLKTRGIKLTFNLNDISAADLDALQSEKRPDEVSFPVPNTWKKVLLPTLSEHSLTIDDPQAKSLRMDFSKQELLPLSTALPITLFFPQKYSATLNPDTYTLASSECITKKNGIKILSLPLYAKGVSRLFLETVKEQLQMVILAAPESERSQLLWSIQFIYPNELEDRYVVKVMSENSNETNSLHPQAREEYLRNRFRSYMNRFRLYTQDHQKLSLHIELQANTITVTPNESSRGITIP